MADRQGLAEHHASVTVNAPVHQVYGLFTHFNDFPKFMSFVKEVTYYDDQRSHWVAEVVGRHEWDAVNENWVEDQQVGWHSTNGLENFGRVTFQPVGTNQTQVDVFIDYNPPAGVLGDVGENLGAGSRFDSVLQHDMDNFARMVDQAPPGALDPTSSNYLFHSDSAAAKGTTTSRQDETMNQDNPGYTTNNPGTGYATNTPDYNNPGYSNTTGTSNPGYTSDQGYSNTTGTNTPGYTSDQGYGANNPAYGTNTPGYTNDNMTNPGNTTTRPVLDQDIINEPNNAGTYSGIPGNQGNVMPADTGVTNPSLPPDQNQGTNY
jgi:uncharacterized membrane protein